MSMNTIESVGEFAELIEETKIEGAKELFKSFRDNLGAVWERYSRQGITPYSIRSLMNSISRFVSISPAEKIKPMWRAALKPFLAEIEDKARACEKWEEENPLNDEI